MGVGRWRRLRPGVLVTLVIAAALLRSAAVTPWWTARLALTDLPAPDVSLSGLRGDVFLWSAVAACVAYGIAALPVPDRARRIVAMLGFVASVVATVALVVLALRVLRHDSDAHRAWTPTIWENYVAERTASDGLGTYLGLAETRAEGLIPAMTATFLLLMLGPLLALPRRYERTALIVSTMALIVVALVLPSSTVWVTTGPQTVDRVWNWFPGYLDYALWVVVVMLVLLALLGAGLFTRPGGRVSRDWGVGWTWAVFLLWSVGSGGTVFLADPSYSPLLDHEPFDYSTPPADQGVVLSGLLVLAWLLPGVVVGRVAIADWRAARAIDRGC